MFKLENIKKLKSTLLSVGLSTLLVSSAMAAPKEASVDGAVKYPIKDGKYSSYHVNTQDVKSYNIGRTPTPKEIKVWDLDVKPDGTGLPEFDMNRGDVVLGDDGKPKKAEGSVEWGGELYDAQCVMCHGDFGAGGKGGYPRPAGGSVNSLKHQRLNPADENPNPESPLRTVGSYWPYASTLYWYVQDSMPYPNSKSLSNSETYAITAYLLSVNGIKYEGEDMDDDFVLDKEKMMKIKMPNADGFYPEVDTKDPRQGVKNMTALLSDPKIYGTGTRCMKDCIKEDTDKLLMKIEYDLTESANQPISVVRDLPKVVDTSVKPGQATYEANCSACHGNPAIGAPVLGDKDAWSKVIAQGIDKVYHNGINGINGMPPKGGSMDLSDDQVKEVIDYMINSSK